MKMALSKAWIPLFVSAFLLTVASTHAQTTLISTGAVWKYLDNGSDQGTAWSASGFDDSTWNSGPAELGFGDGGEATTNTAGFVTYYYRRAFNVADASSVTNLRARIKRDDGAVVYLNGAEVFRDNMPTGEVTSATFAATTAADDGQNFWPHSFSASGLVNGNNVLAVEIHQSALTSSDVSFDLELVANPRPSISITTPTNGQTIASSTISINGSAIPAGASVSLVELFEGANKIGESTNANFTVTWSGVTPAIYTLTAKVTDSYGLQATSAGININVQAPPASMLIPRNSVWKYHNLNQDLGTAWLALGYDDSAANGWGAATAPLGYNFEAPNNFITSLGGTEINIAPDNATAGGRYPTIYFRKTVNVSAAGAYQGLTLRVMRDDAAFIYLNGQFVTNVGCAGNFESDPPTLPHTSFCCAAPGAVSGTDEYQYWEYRIPSTFLVDGPNIFAVEGRNQAASSSDLAFDMEVEGFVDTAPPLMESVDPSQGSSVLDLSFIDVTFDKPVQGVNPSDLLINSEPATNINVISPREYTFYFPTPNTGIVQVAWAPNHGITDTTPLANPFGGGSWTYRYTTNLSALAELVISEFMANNNSGIKDDDSSRQDWIEIYNPGPLEQNMDGWFLTDDTNNLAKWRFPAAVFQPNSYTIVWASAKDRRDPNRPLHTNFKLGSSAGGYLALLDPNTNIVSEFFNYPAQNADISYGRDKVDPSLVGFFTTPTPGAQNSVNGPGFAAAPIISVPSGVYTNDTLAVAISSPMGGSIYYTLDGSVPTSSSTLYTGGTISITGDATLKARVYNIPGTNLFPSAVVARTYLLVDSSLRNFDSNLPLLICDGHSAIPANVIGGGVRARGNLVVIDTQGGRASFHGAVNVQEAAEFEVFGQTSSGFPKLPIRIEVEDELGNDKDVSILGLPADSDWKLRNPYSDKCLINDFMGYELFEQMGNYSCRRRLVEVFTHQSGTKLSSADYQGVLVLFETIKIGKKRTDLQKLSPYITAEPDLSGGYIFKKDKDSAGDLNFATVGGAGLPGQGLKYHDPKPRELNPAQVNYLRNFLIQMENAMYTNTWLTATGTNHYSYYLNPDAFVEQFWIIEFTKQIDGYRLSDYFSKDRNGRVGPVPIWDWNLSFGNANYLDGGHSAGWYYALLGASDHPWARRLITGSAAVTGIGDPDFCQKVADRWAVLRTNVMNGTRILARIDELGALLSEAANRDNARFQTWGIYLWPNPDGARNGDGPTIPWDIDYQHPTDYPSIINQMKHWTQGRFDWIESQFTVVPTFSQPGGQVASGATVSLSGAAGATIYYTLDGTDPRASGGAQSASAIVYSAPITVNGNVKITARAKKASGVWQNTWSGPVSSTYFTGLPALRISEIMYHPTGILGNTNDNDNFEFIEVQNTGGTPLNVNRFSIGGGIQFQFPNSLLAAGESAVIVKDINAFQLRYGTNTVRILGAYTGNLANDGDHLVLSGPAQEPIEDFSYADSWYPATDGAGFSLVRTDLNGQAGLASSWSASANAGGSPGAVDPTPASRPGIVINEVRTYGDPLADAIELYNPTASAASIGGWFLTDDFNKPMKFIIPPTTIPAGGFVTFTESDFNSNTNDPNSFALGRNGDSVYLFSGNGVSLTGYAQGFDFGNAELGVNFGRYVDSTGDDHFVAQAVNTLGAANAGPKVGPVVITEIHYHPSDLLVSTNGLDNQIDEFIELQNITDSSVNLFDSSRPTNTWHLRNAVDFNFPQSVSIPAGGFVLVVGFDPAQDINSLNAFRQRLSVPVSVPIFGPWSGHLENDAETIELHKPRNADTNATYILVERIKYSDSAPWPVGADGLGLTLQRKVASSFGNDPINWAAAAPTPGGAYVGGTPPSITGQPGDQFIAPGTTQTFNVSANGSGPLQYQWQFMGKALTGATNASLTLNNFQSYGFFNVLVYNGGGYAIGSNFLAEVYLTVTGQPQSRSNIVAGATTNFSIVALGTGPIRYQWYFNGNPIISGTNATLTVTNAQAANEGSYYCNVRDDFRNTNSALAFMTVVTKPVITQQPIAVTAVEGRNAVFTIASLGTPPLTFIWTWRTNNITIPNQIVVNAPTNSAMILTNLPLAVTGARITVAVSNASLSTAISSVAILTVLRDTDHDGLPDSWETNHVGFSTNNPADALRDDDGDGMNNLAEYIAGTDYTNAASYLKVQTIGPGIGRLQFTAVTNRTYTVQYTDSLNSPDWKKLADVLAKTTTRTETIIDRNATTNRFYRLVIPIQP